MRQELLGRVEDWGITEYVGIFWCQHTYILGKLVTQYFQKFSSHNVLVSNYISINSFIKETKVGIAIYQSMGEDAHNKILILLKWHFATNQKLSSKWKEEQWSTFCLDDSIYRLNLCPPDIPLRYRHVTVIFYNGTVG